METCKSASELLKDSAKLSRRREHVSLVENKTKLTVGSVECIGVAWAGRGSQVVEDAATDLECSIGLECRAWIKKD